MADMQDEMSETKASNDQVDKPIRAKRTLKYKLPFYGRLYRRWSKFIHKHGYHYAPRQYPPEPHEVKLGLLGVTTTEWYHWCTWCGLRGTTIDIGKFKASDLQPSDPETKLRPSKAHHEGDN